jgi:hypothetical protein
MPKARSLKRQIEEATGYQSWAPIPSKIDYLRKLGFTDPNPGYTELLQTITFGLPLVEEVNTAVKLPMGGLTDKGMLNDYPLEFYKMQILSQNQKFPKPQSRLDYLNPFVRREMNELGGTVYRTEMLVNQQGPPLPFASDDIDAVEFNAVQESLGQINNPYSNRYALKYISEQAEQDDATQKIADIINRNKQLYVQDDSKLKPSQRKFIERKVEEHTYLGKMVERAKQRDLLKNAKKEEVNLLNLNTNFLDMFHNVQMERDNIINHLLTGVSVDKNVDQIGISDVGITNAPPLGGGGGDMPLQDTQNVQEAMYATKNTHQNNKLVQSGTLMRQSLNEIPLYRGNLNPSIFETPLDAAKKTGLIGSVIDFLKNRSSDVSDLTGSSFKQVNNDDSNNRRDDDFVDKNPSRNLFKDTANEGGSIGTSTHSSRPDSLVNKQPVQNQHFVEVGHDNNNEENRSYGSERTLDSMLSDLAKEMQDERDDQQSSYSSSLGDIKPPKKIVEETIAYMMANGRSEEEARRIYDFSKNYVNNFRRMGESTIASKNDALALMEKIAIIISRLDITYTQKKARIRQLIAQNTNQGTQTSRRKTGELRR